MIVLAAAAVVGVLRRDLLRPMLILAAGGAAWGPVSEYWFFKDYWRPQGVLGDPWLEDILFGAGISALACGLFPLVSGRRLTDASGSGARQRLAVVPGFVVAYVAAMTVLQGLVHINSILVAMLVNIAVTGVMTGFRRDLGLPALATAALVAVGSAAGYAVGLDLVVDGQAVLGGIWLLHGTPLGVTVLGNVPLTEVLWYASWSALTSIGYAFVTGSRLAPRLVERPA